MGTMNVYIGGTSKLMASLANEGALPRALGADSFRSVPRRPLVLIGLVGLPMLAGLIVGVTTTEALVRATSACFIAVYVLALASAVRILDGVVRKLALGTLALTVAVALFSGWYLLVPLVAAAAAVALRRSLRVADDDAAGLEAHDRRPRDLVVSTGMDPETVRPALPADAEPDHLEA
jgi:amino acid efflux transporter